MSEKPFDKVQRCIQEMYALNTKWEECACAYRAALEAVDVPDDSIVRVVDQAGSGGAWVGLSASDIRPLLHSKMDSTVEEMSRLEKTFTRIAMALRGAMSDD